MATFKKASYGWTHIATGIELHGSAGNWRAARAGGDKAERCNNRDDAIKALEMREKAASVPPKPPAPTMPTIAPIDYHTPILELMQRDNAMYQRRITAVGEDMYAVRHMRVARRSKALKRFVRRKVRKAAMIAGLTLLAGCLMGAAYALTPVAYASKLVTTVLED